MSISESRKLSVRRGAHPAVDANKVSGVHGVCETIEPGGRSMPGQSKSQRRGLQERFHRGGPMAGGSRVFDRVHSRFGTRFRYWPGAGRSSWMTSVWEWLFGRPLQERIDRRVAERMRDL